MKEILNEGMKFEKICIDIMSHYAHSLESNVIKELNNYNYELDAIIGDTDNVKAIIEVKYYRRSSVAFRLIEKALERLQKCSNISGIPNRLLIISTKLDYQYKQELEQRYDTQILDIENLMYLAKKIPNRKMDLLGLLDIKSDNERNIKESRFDFAQIFKRKNTNYSNTNSSNQKSKGELLYEKLMRTKPGNSDYLDYERTCQEILKYLFDSSLKGWHEQQTTDDGINRFDLICRIDSDDSIWSLFTHDFQTRYLLFEFKNYKNKITQGQVHTTEKYLFAKALRTIAIIISRKGADTNALKASDGILRECGKLLLHIDDNGLQQMLMLMDSGSDPAEYLYNKLDDMLLKLSK